MIWGDFTLRFQDTEPNSDVFGYVKALAMRVRDENVPVPRRRWWQLSKRCPHDGHKLTVRQVGTWKEVFMGGIFTYFYYKCTECDYEYAVFNWAA